VTVLEMRGCLVTIQIGEDRCQRLTSVEHVGGLTAFAIHVDREAGVRSEQGHLPVGVTAVGTVGVVVEQLADGEPVSRCELGVDSHGRSSFSPDG
jgi:hypothetical protein